MPGLKEWIEQGAHFHKTSSQGQIKVQGLGVLDDKKSDGTNGIRVITTLLQAKSSDIHDALMKNGYKPDGENLPNIDGDLSNAEAKADVMKALVAVVIQHHEKASLILRTVHKQMKNIAGKNASHRAAFYQERADLIADVCRASNFSLASAKDAFAKSPIQAHQPQTPPSAEAVVKTLGRSKGITQKSNRPEVTMDANNGSMPLRSHGAAVIINAIGVGVSAKKQFEQAVDGYLGASNDGSINTVTTASASPQPTRGFRVLREDSPKEVYAAFRRAFLRGKPAGSSPKAFAELLVRRNFAVGNSDGRKTPGIVNLTQQYGFTFARPKNPQDPKPFDVLVRLIHQHDSKASQILSAVKLGLQNPNLSQVIQERSRHMPDPAPSVEIRTENDQIYSEVSKVLPPKLPVRQYQQRSLWNSYRGFVRSYPIISAIATFFVAIPFYLRARQSNAVFDETRQNSIKSPDAFQQDFLFQPDASLLFAVPEAKQGELSGSPEKYFDYLLVEWMKGKNISTQDFQCDESEMNHLNAITRFLDGGNVTQDRFEAKKMTVENETRARFDNMPEQDFVETLGSNNDRKAYLAVSEDQKAQMREAFTEKKVADALANKVKFFEQEYDVDVRYILKAMAKGPSEITTSGDKLAQTRRMEIYDQVVHTFESDVPKAKGMLQKMLVLNELSSNLNKKSRALTSSNPELSKQLAARAIKVSQKMHEIAPSPLLALLDVMDTTWAARNCHESLLESFQKTLAEEGQLHTSASAAIGKQAVELPRLPSGEVRDPSHSSNAEALQRVSSDQFSPIAIEPDQKSGGLIDGTNQEKSDVESDYAEVSELREPSSYSHP